MQTVISDAVLAIVAGADTTATTLNNVFFHLISSPGVYSRLQKEVDKYYPPGENALDLKHYAHMVYLDAVM